MFYVHDQKSHVSNDNYLEAKQNLVDVVDHCGGNLAGHKSLTKYMLHRKGITAPLDNEKTAAATEAKDAFETMAYLCGLNKERYQDIPDIQAKSYLADQEKSCSSI